MRRHLDGECAAGCDLREQPWEQAGGVLARRDQGSGVERMTGQTTRILSAWGAVMLGLSCGLAEAQVGPSSQNIKKPAPRKPAARKPAPRPGSSHFIPLQKNKHKPFIRSIIR